jgi:hypothetical protein
VAERALDVDAAQAPVGQASPIAGRVGDGIGDRIVPSIARGVDADVRTGTDRDIRDGGGVAGVAVQVAELAQAAGRGGQREHGRGQ